MNRVQSGNMPSMDEILSDPTMRDLYVEDIVPRWMLTDLLPRANQFGGGRS